MQLMNGFFELFAPLAVHPWIALLIAVALAVLAWRTRRVSSWVVAVVWLLYFLYETSIRLRLICSRECDVRLDLLVIYPVLACISLVGLFPSSVSMWRRWRRGPVGP